MKTALNNLRYTMFMLVMMVLSTVYSFAQEVSSSHSSVTTSSTSTVPDTSTDMWYNAPWVWIVGAGVVLLLLLLLIRGGSSRRDSSRRITRTTTTTVRTE